MKKIFFVAAVFISSQLPAQKLITVSQQDTTTLDEVILTANKFEQKQSQTGKVVTVITKEQLQKSGGKTIAQVLNEQAGITIAGAYNAAGSVQTVFMRGASSGRTLILLDGIPVSDPSMIYNESDLNFFSIHSVERIEMCKGAQSTLYGSDAIAGVINIITIKSEINKPINIEALSMIGNKNSMRNSFQVYGKLSKLTCTGRFSKFITDGFSSAHDNTGINNYDKDGYNGNAANAMIQYEITPELSLKTFVQHNRYKAEIDAGVFTDDKDFTLRHSNLISGLGFSFKKNIAAITGNYQYSKLKREFLNDSLHAPGFIKFERNDYGGETHFFELFGNIRTSSGFTFLAGLDHRRSGMNQEYFSVSSFGPYSNSFPDTSIHQSSFYSSLFFSPTNKKLNIEIGGRINIHSRYGNNATYTFNPSFIITKDLRVFGSMATGFKSPSLYQLYDAFSGNPELEAEKAANYEIGVHQVNKKISSRLVYFYRDIKNGIDYNYVNNRYFNFVRQWVNGIELELSVNPIKQFTISANYSFISGKEETQSRKNFNDTIYHYLLRRPKHNMNVTAGYQFNSGLYLSISGKSVSRRYDVGGFMQEDVLLKNYFLLNAYAEYKMNKYLKFFADAQNLLNKKFFEIRGYNAIPFFINGGMNFSW